MTNKILIVLICFSCYSCATLINKKYTQIEIHTIPESTIICLDNDSCIKSPVIIEIPRSHDDFKIIVKNDTIEKSINIKSRLAPEFLWGNLIFLEMSPIGYIIDGKKQKKMYSYDNSILVDLSNKKNNYKKWKTSKKEQSYFRSSLPWFDFVKFDNGQIFNKYSSYIGLTIGFDYYYSKRSYISFSGGATGIDDIPLPVADRWYVDTTEFVKSYSAKLTSNYDINIYSSNNLGFTLGLGLSYSNFNYRQIFSDTINHKEIELYKNSISTMGLCFDANMYLFKYFYVGFSVMPSYYTIDRNKWEYSQLSYFEFGIRLPLGYYVNDEIKTIKYKPKK